MSVKSLCDIGRTHNEYVSLYNTHGHNHNVSTENRLANEVVRYVPCIYLGLKIFAAIRKNWFLWLTS